MFTLWLGVLFFKTIHLAQPITTFWYDLESDWEAEANIWAGRPNAQPPQIIQADRCTFASSTDVPAEKSQLVSG